jgi:hypothetical protein
LRVFTGYIFNAAHKYPLALSGGAQADYQCDAIFPGRNELYGGGSVFGYQYAENHGGFAAYSPFYTNKWIATTQLKIKVPKIPVNVFASCGTYSEAGDEFLVGPDYIKSNQLAYEAGFELGMGKFMSLYFPVFTSGDIDSYLSTVSNKYIQKVRFSLNLSMLNLFELRDKIVK